MAEMQIVAGKESNKYYTFADIFYANRHSFWTAGQDSYTLPPAQNPDLFMQLLNVEPVTQGILQRRRGYTLFSNQSPAQPFTRAYAFRSEALSLRRLIWTSPSSVLATDETGASILNPIFTPSPAARAPRMVLSRDFGYFADGVAADYQKWDGTTSTGALTNWGIALNTGSTGPNTAGAAADQGGAGSTGSQGPNNAGSGVTKGNVGTAPWFNPNNVTIAGSAAIASLSASGFLGTDQLLIEGFNFNIPNTATINGISFSVTRACNQSGIVFDTAIFIIKGGTAQGSPRNNGTAWPTTPGVVTYGGSTDRWGLSWTPADINAPNFGLSIVGEAFSPSGTAQARILGIVTCTVFYTLPSAGSWVNPGNIIGACDNVSATSVVSTSATSNLQASNFNFTTVPTGTITGIQVDITAASSNPGISMSLNPILVKAGVAGGQRKTLNVTSAGLSTYTFGGQFDTWAGTWTPADFNSVPTFGVQFNAVTTAGQATISVDCVRVTVFTQAGPVTVGAPTGTGNINLISGRTYFYTFENSKTGHNSTLSPASVSTGPVTNAASIPLSALPVPLDPQVDTLLVLATADGNDQTTLFLAGSVPAGTTTFTDTMPDTVLLTQPVFQQTDAIGQLHGVANNNPPDHGDFPTKHKGRIYMAHAHHVHFSKSLDDVTTSTGTITGKWEEAFPFVNVIDLSEFSETITALLSDGETLWIGTERNIRRLIGDSPLNFQKPEIQFNECGVLNQEVWKIVFYEGQPVGTMWMTPDRRVMSSDFNSYRDVGTPVQDVLNTINPAALGAVHANFVSKQAFDLYLLHIPTGVNTVPDTICVYNLRTQRWSIWQPTDQISSSVFNIDINGNPQWLFSALAGPLYFWDSTTLQDRTGNGPLSYPVTVQTSWLDLGDYNIRKFVNQIIPTTADQSALTVAVEGASNELDFNNPLSVVSATTVTPAAIPTDVFVPLASGPSHSRAFRFTFVSPASTVQNVLTGFAIEAGAFHRY